MAKAWKWVLILVLVGIIGWVAYEWFKPEREGVASVTCGEMEGFQSDLGLLNIPQLSLGQYSYVDTARLVAFHGGFLPSNETVETESVASINVGYDASLSLSISGEVPADIRAQAEEALSRSTRLMGVGVRRETIANVLSALNADSAASANIKGVISRGRAIPYVVHAVVKADSIWIGLAETGGGSMDSELLVGEFKLAVQYQCSEALEIFGSQVPVFFKVTPIGFDSATGFYVDTSVALDFAKVRLDRTMR